MREAWALEYQLAQIRVLIAMAQGYSMLTASVQGLVLMQIRLDQLQVDQMQTRLDQLQVD